MPEENNIQEEQPVEELDIVGEQEESPLETDDGLSTVDSIVYATNKLKQPLDAAPTYTPKNFYEQFAHFNDNLYCNINNSWVQVSNPSKSHVRVNRAGAQSISDSTQTTIQFDTEDYDADGDFDTSTYKYTCPRDGKYHVGVMIHFQTNAAGDQIQLFIRKNTGNVAYIIDIGNISGYEGHYVSDTLDCSANDTIEARITHNCGVSRNVSGGSSACYMTIDEL